MSKHAADWNVHGHKVGAHAEPWAWDRELDDAWSAERPAFNLGRHVAPYVMRVGRHHITRPTAAAQGVIET